MLPEYLVQHAIPYTLVLTRLAGVFLTAPMLGGSAVPMRVKALLTLISGAAVYPAVGPSVAAHVAITGEPELLTIVPMFLTEAAIGFVLGLLAAIPLMALEMAGTLIGQQMGFGLAKVYNPEVELDSDVLGRVLFYIGFGAFLALDGIETLFSVLVHSFERIGPGGLSAEQMPVGLLTGVLTSGMELAMRVSAPAIGLVLLVLLAFGVLTKTMPQLNVLSEGFAVKIVGGLAVLAGSLYAIDAAVGDEIVRVTGLIVDWVDGFGV